MVANISNFIPKPQTPYQRAAMQSGEYFEEAHERLRQRKRMRSVALRFTDVESTLIEAALCRGDRRLGQAIEAAWRRGARLDAWAERMRPWLWREAIAAAGIDLDAILHQAVCGGGGVAVGAHASLARAVVGWSENQLRSVEPWARMDCQAK